ncbi:hypothetical protein PPERSA_06781 [Pseudocohnilembus persalinus]|uniref:DBF4-type domain-containing protein n=1 Tax=Pseudocohnilembus persalinus TaxID=266149 RepID=A0A0V0QSB6_PSEPJ|nr:hypothetical protein PPERSA_06781 [Pseudocohnilembus persalinus]|eukprot:KRX05147.1 hypothetical protein PPERSA_06781 [Pseudocohnilembus persalinus]
MIFKHLNQKQLIEPCRINCQNHLFCAEQIDYQYNYVMRSKVMVTQVMGMKFCREQNKYTEGEVVEGLIQMYPDSKEYNPLFSTEMHQIQFKKYDLERQLAFKEKIQNSLEKEDLGEGHEDKEAQIQFCGVCKIKIEGQGYQEHCKSYEHRSNFNQNEFVQKIKDIAQTTFKHESLNQKNG